MHADGTRHTKTYVLLVLMIAAGSLGDVLLSKGMKQIGELTSWTPAALADYLVQVFTHPTVWLGIGGLIAYFICYSLVLSWADLSYVLPASALTYVVVPVMASFWLHENVKALRWAGVAMIFLGVVMVGLTPHTTTNSRTEPAAEGD